MTDSNSDLSDEKPERPGGKPVKRRLAAILAADATGYSRLVAEDEEGTLRTLAAHRAVIDGIIQFHDGRIVGTAGDSVLAEFASPVEAVRCAVEIQEALKTRNESLPETKRMLFRIGVNLGDVIVKGTDLLGDGVNVAARLESIAEPGGICVSSSVYDQIAGKLNMGFVDIGEQNLKNIPRPVRAFRVTGSIGVIQAAAKPKPTPSRAPVYAGVAAALLLAAGAGTWYGGLISPSKAPAPAATAVPTTQTAAPAPVADREAMFWESVRNSNEPAEIEAYLAQYPGGAFSGLARARIDGIVAARAQEQRRAAEAKEKAEADAAAARARAEAEAATVRARAEAEVATAAKVKAEAEAAAAKAKSETETAAARRQAEADRAAAARTKAEAEAAATRVKAEAEQAAQATREAEAARQRQAALTPPRSAVGTNRFDGTWTASRICGRFEEYEGFADKLPPFTIRGGQVVIERGQPGQPFYFMIRGNISEDGSLVFLGSGISGPSRYLGQSFPIRIAGRFTGDVYQGEGRFGGRQCSMTLTRATP